MIEESVNPFAVTKAVDFTDEQIAQTFVDLPGEGGFVKLMNPVSPMPMLILGGKGSGRTHLMRYFSYPLQKLRRGGGSVIEAVQRDGYVGVYSRCEGLNAGRFDGKQQSPEVWESVFAHFFDLWLAQIVLESLHDLLEGWAGRSAVEPAFCRDVLQLLDHRDFGDASNIQELASLFRELQRRIDVAVNNVALTRQLSGVVIRSTRGRLVFGIPEVAQKHFPVLADVLFVYLLDEFENLTKAQQEYVNTLIREKRLPSSIKVGARRYGVRSYRSLSATEENREGSEYELLLLDEHFRANKRYKAFAHHMVARRLIEAKHDPGGEFEELLGLASSSPKAEGTLELKLKHYFQEIQSDPPFERPATQFIETNYAPGERPYLVRLGDKLEAARRRGQAPGIQSDVDAIAVVAALRLPDYPLVERTNVFLLYQAWYSRENLKSAAEQIRAEALAYIDSPSKSSRHKRVLGHFRGDLLAQLLREGRQPQRYVGLETFVSMSSGLPRLLLMILKHVHRWAIFNGETPFRKDPISIRSQLEGVMQASSWFFHDARTLGPDAQLAQEGVERLATFFRRLRFTDKPVESSLTTFSVVLAELSPSTQRAIRHAAATSLLIEVLSGQKERNSKRVVDKYQLNPMLCPRYDLPLARRGVISLNAEEADVLFGGGDANSFERVVQARELRMTAPFVKREREPSTEGGDEGGDDRQPMLPGLS